MQENLEQIIAIVIFVIMFAFIITEKVHRTWAALGGAILTSAIILRSPSAIYHSVNWETIIFIFGMMVMVEGLARSGFFRWLCLYVSKIMGYNVMRIFIAFMLLSGFLAMFIDSITVLLFLTAIIIELARLLKFNPIPMIIAVVFAANTGGSATMSGDPPNIIIGTSFGFSFFDFAVNTGIIAWIGMIATLIFFYFAFRKALQPAGILPVDTSQLPQPAEAVTDRRLFRLSTLIFIAVVAVLVTHNVSGLTVDWIGVIAAVSTLLAVLWVRLTVANSGLGAALRGDLNMLKGVDWRTLLFFLGLFITVGGLEKTGVLERLAGLIGNATGGQMFMAITMILWISAFASAIVDNIPFAATMVPVVRALAHDQGWDLAALSWPLALGTDIGGNATPIGASANVVATAIAHREGYHISWGKYCKYALPAMVLVMGLCNVYLLLRYT
jgi:Na+/H+ antiporter NhaD/arsenite permease-like protein